MSYHKKAILQHISRIADRFASWFNRRYSSFFTNENKKMRLYEPLEEQLK